MSSKQGGGARRKPRSSGKTPPRTARSSSGARTGGGARQTSRSGARGGPRPTRPRVAVPEGTPSIALSLARGLLTTMSSVPLVALTLLSTFLLWAGFAAVGAGSGATAMAQYLSLPPLHSSLDLNFLFSVSQLGGGRFEALAAFVVLMAFRGFFAVVAVSLAASAHAGRPAAEALRRAVFVLPRQLGRLVLIESAFLGLAFVSFILYGVLGALGIVAPLVAGLYVGAYVETAAVVEDQGPREALGTSYKVARLARSGHALMVSSYIALIIALTIVQPGRAGVATPTVAVWIYAFVGSLLNVSFLSAFVHRLSVLRPLVVEGAGREEPAGDAPDPEGAGDRSAGTPAS